MCCKLAGVRRPEPNHGAARAPRPAAGPRLVRGDDDQADVLISGPIHQLLAEVSGGRLNSGLRHVEEAAGTRRDREDIDARTLPGRSELVDGASRADPVP